MKELLKKMLVVTFTLCYIIGIPIFFNLWPLLGATVTTGIFLFLYLNDSI